VRTLLPFVLLLPACSPDPCPAGSARDSKDGLCYLLDAGNDTGTDTDDPDDTGPDDTGSGPVDLVFGDPITVLDTSGSNGGGGQEIVEYVDAVIIDDDYAVAAGQGGFQIIPLDGSGPLERIQEQRSFRLDVSDGLMALGFREGTVMLWDVSDPTNPQQQGQIRLGEDVGFFEDVAVDGGRLLLGAHAEGGVFIDPVSAQHDVLGVLPADDAFAVALFGERALITDAAELVLWDVSDLAAPVELDRVEMSGEGRDMDFNGERVAVGLGGEGVAVWDVTDDQLVSRGSLNLPGASLSISLDNDEVWVAGWEQVSLVRVTADGLIALGDEPPVFNGMGVAARNGHAVVADWYGTMTLARERDVAGPEISVDEKVYFAAGGDVESVWFRNNGAFALEVTLDEPADGYTASATSFQVAPGQTEIVRFTAPADLPNQSTTLGWTSNDPDEPTGSLLLSKADRSVGTAHSDFTLNGFTWPSADAQTFKLSEQRGKVVFLAYFALY
jgi:hypothetical protein